MRIAACRHSRLLVTAWVGAVTGFLVSCTPPSANVVVTIVGASATKRPLLLYSGMRVDVCRSFEPYVGSPSVTLTGVSVDPACPNEVDVFAPERSAFGIATDPLIPNGANWISQAMVTGTLTITLPPPTKLPLTLWLVAGPSADQTTARKMRDRLLDDAYPIVETLGPGLTLDTVSVKLAISALSPDCASAGTISTAGGIYDPARINVYFVKNYRNQPNLTPAANCVDVGHPEIVFISWANNWVVSPTLAHELGHSLGLIHPLAKWGHTDFNAAFPAGNLMANGAAVTYASSGQLYAINFSTDSWLNRTGSPLVRPVVRTCQDTWGAGVCPALTMIQAGWPP